MNTKMEHKMDNATLKNFAHLIFVSRELNCSDSGIENADSMYVTGQVEMIMDFCGITTLYDDNFELVKKLITDKDFLAYEDGETEEHIAHGTFMFMSMFPHLSKAEARLLSRIPAGEELITEDGDNLLPSRWFE